MIGASVVMNSFIQYSIHRSMCFFEYYIPPVYSFFERKFGFQKSDEQRYSYQELRNNFEKQMDSLEDENMKLKMKQWLTTLEEKVKKYK
jgi:hypothetical protein